MKIIHTSDLHLDSRIQALTERANERKEELIMTFERLVDFAKTNGVGAIIIAGDLFDTKKPSQKTVEKVLRLIINNGNIEFFYLSGNHEKDSFTESMETIPQNLKIFGEDWQYFRFGDTVITGINVTKTNYNVLYDTLSLGAEDKNIVVMHGQVVDSKTTSENVISLSRLKEKNVDYLALGHIHAYGENSLDIRGRYAYSGCLEGRGFDETGEKGFVLLDTEGGGIAKNRIRSEFISFSKRNIYVAEYDISNEESWLSFRDKVVASAIEKYKKDSLIRIVIKGKHDIGLSVIPNEIKIRLNNVFYYVEVIDESIINVKKEDYENDNSLLGEFIKLTLATDFDENVKNKITEYGYKALQGEDL